MKRIGMANCVSALRIFVAMGLAFVEPLSAGFYALYLICGASDVLDGWIARRTGSASELGARLDSVADLTFYGVLLIRLLPELRLRLPAELWWAAGAAVALRLTAYAVAAVKYRRFAALHTWLNKLTGAAVFSIPCIMPLTAFVPLCAAVCAIAALAATEELLIHVCAKEYRAGTKTIIGAEK